jgi:hypothetical protein
MGYNIFLCMEFGKYLICTIVHIINSLNVLLKHILHQIGFFLMPLVLSLTHLFHNLGNSLRVDLLISVYLLGMWPNMAICHTTYNQEILNSACAGVSRLLAGLWTSDMPTFHPWIVYITAHTCKLLSLYCCNTFVPSKPAKNSQIDLQLCVLPSVQFGSGLGLGDNLST